METETIQLQKMRVELQTSSVAHVEGVVIPKLCHGDTIVRISSSQDLTVPCDALMTSNTSLALGIATADCAPICFADGETIAIGHVGWRGLCLGLAEKMLGQFKHTPEIYVGPHLFAFEIKKDFCYDAITKKFGNQFISTKEENMVFKFKEAIASLLPSNTIFDERNTGEDMSLPSHRRNGSKERLVTVIKFAV